MKFNLSLKNTHLTIIEDLKVKYGINTNEEIILKAINVALKLNNNDLIFGTEREKCNGGCFASEPQFQIDVNEEDFSKMKKIFKDYDFDEYKSDEEEVSKIIRCIINFIDDDPDLISN